jgi:GNAT superfamily N-acetyltransferase
VTEEITPTSELGRELGYSGDVYEGIVFRKGDYIYIKTFKVHEEHRRKGYFNRLLTNIHALGYNVAVMNPNATMEKILIRKKFRPHVEGDDIVWKKPIPKTKSKTS